LVGQLVSYRVAVRHRIDDVEDDWMAYV